MTLLLALGAATPLNAQTVDNTATANYQVGAVPFATPSNLFSIPLASVRTTAMLELWRYAPGAGGVTPVDVNGAECSPSGATGGPFIPSPGPTTVAGAAIGLGTLDMLPGDFYALGEPVFLRVVDGDQNGNAALAETLLVQISASGTGDQLLVRLQETGPNTGEFTGWAQTADVPAIAGDCLLSAVRDGSVTATYTDVGDLTDTEIATALIRPLSLLFDATTGAPISGLAIRLVDDTTGLDASPLGDDGVSPFPATIVSGGTATDGIKTYVFAPGTFRFPYVPAGTYRFEVTPATDYVFPSFVPDLQLQALPGAPFTIVSGSRGDVFTVGAPGPIDIDLPVDPRSDGLFLSITANKSVVGVGEFVQYNVRVRNPGTLTAPAGIDLNVILPPGFRFRPGTATIDALPVPDPVVQPDGRTLPFVLPAIPGAAFVNIRVVAEVTTGTPLGEAIALAQSTVIGTATSHSARNTIMVREDLFTNTTFILGQIALGSCDGAGGSIEGVAGVRVYLEDGTYAVTDERGLYHFEGIEPGVHVVQVDMDTVAPQLDMQPCGQNTRFAGRSFSQFVDLQGGTLWRADFAAVERPPEQGYVNHQLKSSAEDGVIAYRVSVRGSGVPLRNLTAVTLLPEGVRYAPGSSRLDGKPIADPAAAERAVVHRLGGREGQWAHEIEFRAELSRPELLGERLVTESFAKFATPTSQSAQTPRTTNVTLGASRSASGVRTKDTIGLRPGDAWEAPPAPAAVAEAPVYDKAWLERVDGTLEFVEPAPEFRPRSPNVHPGLKHDPAHAITIEINGEEVPAVHFDGQSTNSAKTAALSRWRGIDLIHGPNRLVAIARDAAGREVGKLERSIHYAGPAISVELLRGQSRMVADGRNPVVVAVRFTDKWDEPAREGTIGPFTIDAGYQSNDEFEAFDERALAGLAPERPEYEVGPDGVALIELAPTGKSGRALLSLPMGLGEPEEVPLWIEPEARDWVLVGLAEGTLAHANLTGNMQTMETLDFEEDWDVAQRMSLFAKGRIKGDWLLTLAYDSKKRSDKRGETLGDEIDPQQYYTLYGSKSEQSYGAPTSEKLYVKLERRQFYALFGDYDTEMSTTELTRYNRSFTGLKTEYAGEVYSFNGFATQTSHGFIRDEIRGDGTSGLYQLTRKDLVRNSDKIVIETRDRFQTEIVLASEPMSRHTDYDIDYDRGTLFFRKPIASQSGFDPVFIVAEYESDDVRDESLVAGGRGAAKFLDDRMELGASALHEGNTGQNGELVGADFKFDFDTHTELRAEYAWSNTRDVKKRKSAGSAYLAELGTNYDWMNARAYVREQQAEFGLGQQSSTENATRKFGLDTRYRINDAFAISGEAFRQTNLTSETDRDVLEGRLEYAAGPAAAYTGFRQASDEIVGSPDQTSQLVLAGGGYRMLDSKLLLRADTELSVGGQAENADYPSRVIFGADYDVLPELTTYAEHEFTFGDVEDAHSTRAGLRARPWNGATANTSVEQQLSESGARTFANLGLTQGWQVNDKWSIDLSFDRTATLRDKQRTLFSPTVPPTSGSIDDDFTAVSIGSTYRMPKWSVATRLENRLGEQENRWNLFTGFHHEFADGIGYGVGIDLFDTDSRQGNDTRNGEVKLGFVYRPLGSKWIVLDRAEFDFDEQSGDFDLENRKLINNTHVNFQWNHKTQLSFQYGAKYLLDQVDSLDVDGFIDLYGAELRRDINETWDIGLHGRLRNSHSADVLNTSYGASIGYKMATNLWVSAGYNFAGFRDDDFSQGNYTSEGPFLRFRYKFDQQTIRDLIQKEW